MTATPQGPSEPTARTPGAHRARRDEHVFNFDKLARIMGGPTYSSLFGGCVEGERIIVALMRAPAGKYSDYHSHPNEQWIYVLQGQMDLLVGGKSHLAGPGELVYIPANTVHKGGTPGDKDAVVLTFKDGSHGLHGTRQEGREDGSV